MNGLRPSELNDGSGNSPTRHPEGPDVTSENERSRKGLLNLKEATDLLGLTEEEVRYFVSCGKIPAYKIGGKFLRFKRDQVEALRGRIKILKHQLVPIEKISPADETSPFLTKERDNANRKAKYSARDKIRDFLYFNDFYFLAAILIALLIFVIVRKR